ncbi:hypothetical protein ROZALSC1DRAFT_28379 [Rozella allomycis CSF55]|uniref:Uncharacterized protein n=1 Tax=Rozella allomycis (strain CSF55) TaxID=988480 RepID=A0A075AX38_ROZAC|nr:hypothetical protein O9G_001638 [Rozella allomycis CSF55]RKP20098.1 hypothetical protein ROZALSC1DRAFT_28379 [Rozella allomycis CSF55]|eukprot:EPZ33287.1 hypothetical protein O9G_001638 [Rozella allomycis CSF55]
MAPQFGFQPLKTFGNKFNPKNQNSINNFHHPQPPAFAPTNPHRFPPTPKEERQRNSSQIGEIQRHETPFAYEEFDEDDEELSHIPLDEDEYIDNHQQQYQYEHNSPERQLQASKRRNTDATKNVVEEEKNSNGDIQIEKIETGLESEGDSQIADQTNYNNDIDQNQPTNEEYLQCDPNDPFFQHIMAVNEWDAKYRHKLQDICRKAACCVEDFTNDIGEAFTTASLENMNKQLSVFKQNALQLFQHLQQNK